MASTATERNAMDHTGTPRPFLEKLCERITYNPPRSNPPGGGVGGPALSYPGPLIRDPGTSWCSRLVLPGSSC